MGEGERREGVVEESQQRWLVTFATTRFPLTDNLFACWLRLLLLSKKSNPHQRSTHTPPPLSLPLSLFSLSGNLIYFYFYVSHTAQEARIYFAAHFTPFPPLQLTHTHRHTHLLMCIYIYGIYMCVCGAAAKSSFQLLWHFARGTTVSQLCYKFKNE